MVFDTLTTMTIALAVSFVIGELFNKLKYPHVIGQILAGVLIGFPFIRSLFGPGAISDISFLSDLGIIFLLLLTGMKVDISKFRKSTRDTAVISVFSVFIPLIMGFIFVKAAGFSTITALVVGAAISLTAEGTNLKVLLDLRAINSRIGIIMLGAGILDDVFEVLFLSVVLVLAHQSFLALTLLPIKIILFVVVVFLSYQLFPRVLKSVQKEHSRIATFSIMLLFGLVVAVLSSNLELGPIIGAFFAGVIIRLADKNKGELLSHIKELEAVTFAFVIPFFFINIGLHFDVTSIGNNIYLALAITLVALISKLLAAYLAKPFTTLTWAQATLIGWGLNSRGAIELVIAQVALETNLISVEIYSSLVFMALVTTLMFPFIMKYMIRKNRSILQTASPKEHKA